MFGQFELNFGTVFGQFGVEISRLLLGQSENKFQKYFWVFLDSVGSSLSLQFNHMLVDNIWCPHNF